MVTSPGGTSAAALHELESGRLRTVLSEAVWAAFRRTVELGDQLEAQPRHGDTVGPTRLVTARHRHATRHDRRSTFVARRWPTCATSTFAPPTRDFWADEAALWDRLLAELGGSRRRGLAPARAPRRPTRAAPTGRWPSTSATSPTGRSSRSTTSAPRSRPADGRPTTTTTAATSIGSTSAAARRGRRCRATAIAGPARAARAAPARGGTPAAARARSAATTPGAGST